MLYIFKLYSFFFILIINHSHLIFKIINNMHFIIKLNVILVLFIKICFKHFFQVLHTMLSH